MSFNVNKVLIGGNLTRDPELRYTQSGLAICKFGLAINEVRGKGEERKESVCFVNVVAFARTAEVIAEYFKKGKPILITDAKLDFSQWEDKVTGAKRSSLGVKCEAFQFVDNGDSGPAKDAPKPPPNETQSGKPVDYDDIPF